MSLQELAGSIIHLKLSIREGHGFGFLKSPVVIVAGANGIYLETEVVPPSPDPLFHIDLVWETDKRNLRRFRASNTPIKLECFTVGPNNQRDCIGSTLLNIKSAQVIPRGSLKNVSDRWHKLIGVPTEAKALQPELLLSLTIQEPNSLSQPLSGSTWEGNEVQAPSFSAQQTVIDASKMQESLPLFETSSVPSPEYKQGYVQLGPEMSCVDTFLLTLSVKRVLEMDLLLRGHDGLLNFSGSLKPLQISFLLMGHVMRTKQFGNKSFGKVCHVNEEVILPLRTSLSILHLYLQENPCAAVCVLYCGQEIAAAELHIRSLVPTNDVQSFSHEFSGETTFTQKCILVSSSSGSIPLQDGQQPCITVTTKLQLTSSTVTPQKTLSGFNQPQPLSDNTSFQACVTSKEDPSSRCESRQSQDTFVVTSQTGPVWVPVAPGLIQSHASTTNNVLLEEGPEEIVKLGSERTVTDTQSLYNVASPLPRPLPSGPNPSNENAVKSFNHIQDEMQSPLVNLSAVPLISAAPQQPVIPLDSSTAYKIVEELEDWKEKQQEIFLAELKRTEIEHLACITDEWTKQTKVQDLELDKKMLECKTIAGTLTSAKEDLKDRLITCATREQELRKAKEELDLQYNLKFQELTLAAKRLDEGVKLKVALVESKCSKLEERIRELESENKTLRQQLNQKGLAPTYGHVKTCGMSHGQVSQLLSQVDQLEGKLNASLQSKAYFKEQWGRAVREMNQAKLQFAQTSENSKCIENLLSQEETELQRDQKTVEKLREELAYFNSY